MRESRYFHARVNKLIVGFPFDANPVNFGQITALRIHTILGKPGNINFTTERINFAAGLVEDIQLKT